MKMKRARPQCIAYLTQYVSSSEAKRHTLTPTCAVHRIKLAVGMEYAISLHTHEPGNVSGLKSGSLPASGRRGWCSAVAFHREVDGLPNLEETHERTHPGSRTGGG